MVFALMLQVSARAQKLPWHGKQAEVLAGVSRVLIVPPDVHVDEWSTTTGRELSGTSDHVRRTICGALDQMFEEKKVEVNDYMLCLGEGEATVEKLDALTAVDKHFRELVAAWSKSRHPEELLEGFHLGDEAEIVKKIEVDALLVVCADGNLRTKGEKAIGRLGSGGGAPGESIILHIGVIRPRNGELVFFTAKEVSGDFLKHEDKLEEAVEKAVQAAFSPAPAAAKGPGL